MGTTVGVGMTGPSDGPANGPDGRVTLRTVADAAGVHTSTVSRILNKQLGASSHTASPATVSRVLAVAKELGYTPNPNAKSLRTRQTKHIGVLVPTLSDLVLATIYEGIEDAAERHGYSTYVTNSLDDPERRERQTETMLARHPDAMIFGDAEHHSDFLQRQQDRGIRFCLVSRRVEGFLSSTTDDYLGGCLAARHLLELGFTDVAVLAGQPYASTAIDRTAGFTDTYRSAGHPVPHDHVAWGPFDTAGGRSAMQTVLATGATPDAVFATNDFAAIGAIGGLRDVGLVAGVDVALVGYNDVPLAEALPTPLTTIHSPRHEMGRTAVELIVQLLRGEQPESVRLTPELRVRESTLAARPRSRA
ncbi:LacI family DNA-binding transcriptional regulator [Pseudonocardia sp. GCM10023141]|uniref:LacI family DNA-binding transcriptional regulator n=1 Tax=Pseudonocardia sp. GCM10023141 TaxID=3252653 RepID=UPI003606840A